MAVTYDPSVDYSDLIAAEEAKGSNANASLLAQYESQRNAKIDAEGLPYEKTYNYTTNSAAASSTGLVASSGGTTGGYYTANDQSEYINQIYDAALQAAQAALQSTYDEAMLGYEHAAAEIPEQYRAARNQTSADAAVARANLNEQLAASGLNTGASGQARLAMSIAESNNLATLTRQQQAAIDDLTLQREQTRAQYQAAVAEAIANNDMQRAQALYNEAVRVDESFRSYLEDALLEAQLQMYNAQIEALQAEIQAAASTGTSTGTTTGTSTGSGTTSTTATTISRQDSTDDTTDSSSTENSYNRYAAVFQELRLSTGTTAEKDDIITKYLSQGLITQDEASQLRQAFGISASESSLSLNARSILIQLQSGTYTQAGAANIINSALSNGRISQAEASYLLDYVGY